MTRKLSVLFMLLALLPVSLHAQRVAEHTYWFFFTDKSNTGYSLEQPGDFLSQRSIDRRAWQSLGLDETDLPVNRDYVDSLAALGLTIVHTSKWLNGVLVESTNQPLIDTLPALSFIDTVPWHPDPDLHAYPNAPSGSRFDPPGVPAKNYLYGYSFSQVNQLGIPALHKLGYNGSGVLVAILDGGFVKMDNNLPSFTDLYQEGRLVASRNYVRNLTGVYDGISHGTSVASVLAGNWPGYVVGTAPGASLIIAATENPASETKIEEFAWIQAAEWADSLGADVVNTSLGYSRFDDSLTNYSYEDMDGRTAFISRANSMLAGKGIISVTSAGNEGNDASWYYITAPADASDILAVGAVDSTGYIAGFSSRGPSSDLRIKPDIVAMGVMVALQASDGSARLGNGTSFAGPIAAGAAATLWQAYPAMSAREMISAIRHASNRFLNPDATYGFGIPSYISAYYAISSVPGKYYPGDLKIYPNPFNTYIHIELPPMNAGDFEVTVMDLQGRIVHHEFSSLPGRIDLPADLAPGIYMVDIKGNAQRSRARIIKYE